jgi:hypothetical protein
MGWDVERFALKKFNDARYLSLICATIHIDRASIEGCGPPRRWVVDRARLV